jgi:hypothetical protein
MTKGLSMRLANNRSPGFPCPLDGLNHGARARNHDAQFQAGGVL